MSVMQSAAAGSMAGFVATGPMSAAMLALDRYLPGHDPADLPPEQITEGVLAASPVAENVDEQDIDRMTVATHFGYGAGTGALFGVLARALPMPPVLSGVLFAITVWTLSYFGWVPASGLMPPAHEHPARRNVVMIAAHVVWGASMGLALWALDRALRKR